jgi:fibro-slime domain-containing protein
MTHRIGLSILALFSVTAGLTGCSADDGDPSGGSGSGTGGAAIIDDGTGNGTGTGAGSGTDPNSGESCDGILFGRIRDFHITFPDMEPKKNNPAKSDNQFEEGIVQNVIGEDWKPIYNGPAGGTATTTGPDNFYHWYRDTDQNMQMDLGLKFEDPDGDGVFTYDNQQFFPIDGQLFGNEPEGSPHNYHFTFELHTFFTYKGGEQFTFIGDDDVWTFINGKLVVDLGGIHGKMTKQVDLDTLGLQKGAPYRLDFFFAERHVTESHFRIDTTIEFTDCGVIVR